MMIVMMIVMMMMMRGDSINTVITYHELIAPLLPGTAQPLLATRRWTWSPPYTPWTRYIAYYPPAPPQIHRMCPTHPPQCRIPWTGSWRLSPSRCVWYRRPQFGQHRTHLGRRSTEWQDRRWADGKGRCWRLNEHTWLVFRRWETTRHPRWIGTGRG